MVHGAFPQIPENQIVARILAGDAPMIIEGDERTLPGTLQKAGYVTAVIGKWHIGLGNGSIDSIILN